MKNRWLFFIILLLAACSHNRVNAPWSFKERQIDTGKFVLASWQKLSANPQAVKVYIEGDGASFDVYGQPTRDPTPQGTVVRDMAFGDRNPNVIYLARPCQFNKKGICQQKYWTTARYAPEVIESMAIAIRQAAQGREVILIGFSGGGQVASLIAATRPELNVKRVVTIGGNLDHHAWTEYHKLPSLDDSMDLVDYLDEYCEILQTHFVGNKDTVVPPSLVIQFAKYCYESATDVVSVVGDASHEGSWEPIYPTIWNMR